MHKRTFLSSVVLLMLQSCGGGGSSTTTVVTPPVAKAPTNLQVTAEIVGATTANPEGNGSGTVIFKATATDATAFEIELEGKTLQMPSGQLTYTFTMTGTNAYSATVTASNGSLTATSTVSLNVARAAASFGLTAAQAITAMGTGFNLGNVFDNGLNPSDFNSNRSIIDLYKSVGMKHVRIPVSWLESVKGSTLGNTSTGRIDFTHARFLELKALVDYALSQDLYVVINTHHEHWLKRHYDGSSAFDTKFAAMWTDIANHFKDYSDKLIFDVLNEPEGTMGQWGSTSGFTFPQPPNSTAISLTRQINKVGYDAIRATGGNNTTRVIMVEPNGQGNQDSLDDVYPTTAQLPGGGADAYLAFQVHTYDPWAFCGQDGSDSAYPGADRIAAPINAVAAHAARLGVPVNYGEFGVGRQSGSRSSAVIHEYYKTVRATTLANNMSCSVWDDRGWFGLVSTADGGITYTAASNGILAAMMST
jgi:aryl-phospho-beta-D-glucosidase BglC (GH1 family)